MIKAVLKTVVSGECSGEYSPERTVSGLCCAGRSRCLDWRSGKCCGFSDGDYALSDLPVPPAMQGPENERHVKSREYYGDERPVCSKCPQHHRGDERDADQKPEGVAHLSPEPLGPELLHDTSPAAGRSL